MDRQIIFSEPMIRALLDGRKTQHRVVLKPQPHREGNIWRWHGGGWSDGANPTLVPGHSMYERAPARPGDRILPTARVPHLTLIVEGVKIERLQEINRGGAMEEGCPFSNMANGPNPLDWFRYVWSSIHGADSWDANPWVAALTFRVVKENIDLARTDGA